ncbi:uncharacterized protein BDV14DRAFT_197539 [Aspergillus stella-maris]|uniref:uncharacterized protein n=1 Tax=Aspergillus stella-maris TaxID=1810926 RepID=UPI003CCCD8EB
MFSAQEAIGISLIAITAYNVLEFFLWLWDIFPARKGLYFYSMLIATIGLAGFNAMTFVNFFAPEQTLLQNIGFLLTVPTLMTAHILALYSRLHLLLQPNTRHTHGAGYTGRNWMTLRLMRNVIVGTVVLFTVPHTITLILYIVDDHRFAKANFTTERIAFTSYCVRELFVCGIYIVQGLREIRPIVRAKGAIGRKVMSHLIIGQTVVIVLDLFFIVLIYMGRQKWGLKDYVETSFIGLLYGLKLKLEFVVLNRLKVLLDCPVQRLGSLVMAGVGVGFGAGGGLLNTNTSVAATTITAYEDEKGQRVGGSVASPSSV